MGFSIVPHTWLPEKIIGRLPELRALQAVRTIRDGDRPRCDARGPARRSAACLTRPLARETRIQTIEGGITAPAGFKAAGVYAGIKPPTHAWPLDVMLMTADSPVSAAAVFTTNKTQAAPVLVSRANLENVGRTREGDRLQQRMRQCVHRRRGHGCGALDGGIRRAPGRMPSRRGARRIDGRHRRRSQPAESDRTASRRRSPCSAATRITMRCSRS